MQKKITPWTSAAEAMSELFPGVAHWLPRSWDCLGEGGGEGGGERTRGKLILVASLISKAANLGGN